ncbi:MAG: ABC transporter permease [Deltaproteobacteria bacterium]|nr:ABC transporter permease [Deltaproteobacteria bacterium]
MRSIARWQDGFLELISTRGARALGRFGLNFLGELGDFFIFSGSFLQWTFRAPFRRASLVKQMEFVGVRSLPIILLTATFTGMVFSLQTGYTFKLFHAESMVGTSVGMALSREIGPVFTALMVTARAGSAMAAEIGTMKVTEQVEALRAMAVNPIHFLVVPRVIAGTLMVPLLAALFSFVGVIGAYLVAVCLMEIPGAVFLNKLTYYVDSNDFVGGLIKATVFGFSLSLISCHQGYRTTAGAEGVGRSTTRAVVVSSVTVLVLNYFLTSLIIKFLPDF